MPRAIVYGRRNPSEEHYEALLASEPGKPSAKRQQELRVTAQRLASEADPQAVRPLYLARIAGERDALSSGERADWWINATQQAAAGQVAPAAAVGLTEAAAEGKESETDSYLEKLAKYIPAESLTLTLLAFAALSPKGADVWWLVAGGALVNVLYLFGTALHARKEAAMPRWYFYPLSAIALVLWSIAVVTVVGEKAGIEGGGAEVTKTFVLALAAFLVPLADTIATGLTEIVEEEKAAGRLDLRGLIRRLLGGTAARRPQAAA